VFFFRIPVFFAAGAEGANGWGRDSCGGVKAQSDIPKGFFTGGLFEP